MVAGEVGSVSPWVVVGVAGGGGGFRLAPFGVPGPFPLLEPSAIALPKRYSIQYQQWGVRRKDEK